MATGAEEVAEAAEKAAAKVEEVAGWLEEAEGAEEAAKESEREGAAEEAEGRVAGLLEHPVREEEVVDSWETEEAARAAGTDAAFRPGLLAEEDWVEAEDPEGAAKESEREAEAEEEAAAMAEGVLEEERGRAPWS